MKKTKTTAAIFILILFLTACTRAYQSPTIRLCRLNLELFSGYGTGAPQQLSGQVDIGSSTSYYFQGNFTAEDGTVHPARFYFEGVTVNFTIKTEEGEIYGSGMMESGVYACEGKGGGTQTGPTVGDIGDWRGVWFKEEIPNPELQATPSASTSPFNSSFLWGAGICGAVILVLGLTGVAKSGDTPSQASKAATVSMRRPSQNVTTSSKPPLVEYHATYFAGDNLFDLSIDIKRAERYLGECGVNALNQLDKIPGQATGFEVWLFDPASAETVSKTLISEYCHYIEGGGNIGQVFVIKPQTSLQIETTHLNARVHILDLEYDGTSSYPNSVIKKAVIKIEAWEKPAATRQ